MYDLTGVHVVACADKLDHEKSSFRFRKPFASPEHVHQGAIMTEFQSHVYIFSVFKAVLEENDIRMAERTMNLDLGPELENNMHQQ